MATLAFFFGWLYYVFFAGGFPLSNARCIVSNDMERRIILFPVGDIEGWMLDVLEKNLEKTFECRVERHQPIEVPTEAFDPTRVQYYSPLILKKARHLMEMKKQDKGLAIIDVDLYTEGLNFVFGEAEFGGLLAVISLTRLRQSYYSLPENKAIFTERAIKEAVHELGHLFGLEHCPNPECVMHFSNSLPDTDRKSMSFCAQCQARWKNLIR
jgi:archaemetzincin